jgi:RNA polymerase sigma-70 factor (ECF subfamily)
MPLGAAFSDTHWSVILTAGQRGSSQARAALAELCRSYWYPLYAFIRHRGHDHQSAEDLTQTFFTLLIQSDDLAHVDRSKGRFRSFLLASCAHFLANQQDRARALKRGGGRRLLSIDALDAERSYTHEPVDRLTPEALFTRRWAMTLLDQAIDDLRTEFTREGQLERFEVLKHALTGDRVPYAELAAQLHMSRGALHVAVHRVRERYRHMLRSRIAATVAEPAQIDDEIRDLFAALAT